MTQLRASFKLKNPDTDRPTLILMKTYYEYKRLTYSTGHKIHTQYWHEGMQRPITARYAFLKKELKFSASAELREEFKLIETLIKQGKKENPSFMTEMRNITADLNRYENTLASSYEYLKMQEEEVSFEKLKELLDSKFKKQKAPKPDQNGFYAVFDEFMETQSQIYSVLTIKKYKTLKKKLLQFEKGKRYKITFESIDLIFYDKFKKFMLSEKNARTSEVEGLLNDTISKYISALKTFMQWSLDRGYHTNTAFQHRQFSAKKRVKNEIVTLSEEELMRLYHLDLSHIPRLERVRDLFCFATFTGQRWSDIELFKKEDVKEDVWRFVSYKTKKMMMVPFKGFLQPAKDILLKYDYELPRISQQQFNKYIKEVGKLAGIVEPTVIQRFSGDKRIEIRKPKYAFMSSHMARRTCVTILLQKGVPPTTIMKLTGHTSLKTLMKYENTGEKALINALINT